MNCTVMDRPAPAASRLRTELALRHDSTHSLQIALEYVDRGVDALAAEADIP